MARPMTFVNTAYTLLKESGKPRHYRWLTEEGMQRGLISTEGKTPEATMYASIFSEINSEIPGKRISRFTKIGRGMFGLAEWSKEAKDKEPSKQTAEQRYFIFVVNSQQGVTKKLSAKQIYTLLMKLKAWGINERTPYRRDLSEGSKVVFYQAGKGGQKFIGAATLSSPLNIMSDMQAAERRKVGIEPATYNVDLQDIQTWDEPKPVTDMIQRLEFIGNKDHFGVHFQGGVKRIDEQDYYTIMEFTPPKGQAQLKSADRKYTHSLLQGMLIELGNLLGYETYSADQSPEYRDTTIGELASYESLPGFTSNRILSTARQIDVIWFADEFPVCCFEIEHSTDVTKGLLRMHQLEHFQTQFFVVAPENTRRKFEIETSKTPFYQSQDRYFFRSYEEVEKLYQQTKRFVDIRNSFLNE